MRKTIKLEINLKRYLNPKRISEMDGVRFMSMIGVIGFHLGELMWGKLLMFPKSWADLWRNWSLLGWSPLYLLFIFGDHNVPVFILLSGIGIQIKGVTNWRIWIKNRINKILLPFWIALIGGSLLIWLAWRWTPEVVQRTMIGEFSWDRIILSGLLLQNSSIYTWNSPASAWWLIPVIIQLYLIYPLLNRIFTKLLTLKFLLSVLLIQMIWNLSLLGIMFRSGKFWLYGWFSGLSYILLFSLGIVIGEGIKNHNLNLKNISGIMWLLLGVFVWFWGLELRMISGRLLIFSEVLIGIGGWLIGSVVINQLTRIIPKITENINGIGKRYSYQIYLWHQPILVFIWSLVKALRNVDW